MYILLLVMADHMTSAANIKMLAVEDDKLLGDQISSKENEKVVVKENLANSSGEPDEVDWTSLVNEFFSNFIIPPSYLKWRWIPQIAKVL
ncbi:hypothetical protein POTOM_052857 [Populus tomentosa]|uniref:Uncharacterized protein n=1 Tax=Populus tomentosa TaxID=118781 RepID=A0A8X7Y779_POPTO|nr:hypothetical protein POTOM_052857 [Populus tomentosa]